MKENVYLIGGRAVGKSSVGVKLAESMGYQFFDTDTMIVDASGSSIATIVSRGGWQSFREYEKQVLQSLLSQEASVVATGGGAILHREQWSELKQHGKVFWLMADYALLCKRIKGDCSSAAQRPSITGKDVCQELDVVLEERNPLYRETADYIIDSGKMTIDEVVESIVQLYAVSGKDKK